MQSDKAHTMPKEKHTAAAHKVKRKCNYGYALKSCTTLIADSTLYVGSIFAAA